MKLRQRGIVILALLAVLAMPADAAETTSYTDCVAAVDTDPDTGFALAAKWLRDDGGTAAQHCMALALAASGRYAGAAQLLQDIAYGLGARTTVRRRDDIKRATRVADLLGQAGYAWLMAGNAERSVNALNKGLAESPLPDGVRGELLVDRSLAHVMLTDYASAVADLDSAQRLLGPRYDIYVYRARAHRYLGAMAEAQEDIEKALASAPLNPEAVMERGNQKYVLGDFDQAIEDWLRTGELSGEDSDLMKAAMANIEQAEQQKKIQEDARDAPVTAAPTPPEPPAPNDPRAPVLNRSVPTPDIATE